MRLARYVGDGRVVISEEPTPRCPVGGLLVRTEACGLCSGELMSWYMDAKVPHVLGHEVCGIVEESDSPEFPVGSRVFPHHHAPCMKCAFCLTGRPVHCEQWKKTKLDPGGMADFFAVGALNLSDTWRVDEIDPRDAALIEPLACVWKAVRLAAVSEHQAAAVIGLGGMGLLHLAVLPPGSIGCDLNPARVEGALAHGFHAALPANAGKADVVFVCPGTQGAFDQALHMVLPGGTVVLFAPLEPKTALQVSQRAYFLDLKIVHSYSCGPPDVRVAIESIRTGRVGAQQVCSHFISLDELPAYYALMKAGEILKPMVLWGG